MKRIKNEEKHWREARVQAARSGIMLTRRKTSNGNYVCFLSKKAKESLLFTL